MSLQLSLQSIRCTSQLRTYRDPALRKPCRQQHQIQGDPGTAALYSHNAVHTRATNLIGEGGWCRPAISSGWCRPATPGRAHLDAHLPCASPRLSPRVLLARAMAGVDQALAWARCGLQQIARLLWLPTYHRPVHQLHQGGVGPPSAGDPSHDLVLGRASLLALPCPACGDGRPPRRLGP